MFIVQALLYVLITLKDFLLRFTVLFYRPLWSWRTEATWTPLWGGSRWGRMGRGYSPSQVWNLHWQSLPSQALLLFTEEKSTSFSLVLFWTQQITQQYHYLPLIFFLLLLIQKVWSCSEGQTTQYSLCLEGQSFVVFYHMQEDCSR